LLSGDGVFDLKGHMAVVRGADFPPHHRLHPGLKQGLLLVANLGAGIDLQTFRAGRREAQLGTRGQAL
jgi:hypothetical protein